MLALTLMLFGVFALQGRPPIETLLFSLALAVGLSPELPFCHALGTAREIHAQNRGQQWTCSAPTRPHAHARGDRDLYVIRDGIREGRRTFANTLKSVLTTTSANLGVLGAEWLKGWFYRTAS